MQRGFLWTLLGGALLATGLASGCELIASVDRNAINPTGGAAPSPTTGGMPQGGGGTAGMAQGGDGGGGMGGGGTGGAGGGGMGGGGSDPCANTVQDGNETDVDCGGPDCDPCENGLDCGVAADCASGFCNGTTCAPCSGDVDCSSADWCDPSTNNGTCTPKGADGDACGGGDNECLNDHCVDTYCCDATCDGTCEACDLQSFEGACTPYLAGTDPESECGSDVCGGTSACRCQNGAMDGAESDVDCGGGTCALCITGASCFTGTDCQSGNCNGGTCAPPGCGDGIVNGTDQCDGDGMGMPGETATCDGDCTFVSCNDGHVNGAAGETCDDTGTTAGDGCSATCTVESGWQCVGQPSVCSPICGNGILSGSEACDDGDLQSGDGCSATCAIENGWSCNGQPSVCNTTCGDGIIAGAETCDDSDAQSGDGCSSSCVVEIGWQCSGQPSVCTQTCGNGAVDGNEICDPSAAATPCCAVSCAGPASGGTVCGTDPDGSAGCGAPPQCNGLGATAASCIAEAQPNGSACNDSLFCNGSDTCNGGSCSVHAGNPCPGADGDGNCSESCNEAADNCTAADPNGSACTDALFCNGNDTCNGGTCSAHVGNPCPGADGDGNCSESCNEAADNCTAADPNGSACTDALFCNGNDTCSGGSCSVHPGNPCPGADGDGNCSESCNEAADNCTAADPNGSACTDALFCNGNDTCNGGSCSVHPGDPCPGADGDGNCSETCNEAADNCTAADPNGSACTDALFCNGSDSCSGGSCSSHVGDPCPGADGDGNCSESCDESADACSAADPNGSACTDGLFCNGNDSCGGGSCSSHVGDPCPGADGDGNCSESCDEAADNCSAADPNGSACTDGLFCNGGETCGGGSCGGSGGNPCPGPDGDGDCSESCDEIVDACSAFDPLGSVCNADFVCSGADDLCPSSCSPQGPGTGTCGPGSCCTGATCASNTLATSCGSACVNCAAQVDNKACFLGSCGCILQSDCAPGSSCSGGTCVVACGDGVIGGSEACDDGNTSPGDGCNGSCAIESGWQCSGQPSFCNTVCGDGIVAGSETCDDMNANNNDACPDGVGGTCHTAVCGDGFTFNQGGGTEQCDDANGSSLDGCTTQCVTGLLCNVAQYPGGDGFSVNPATGNCYVSFDGEQTTWAAAETSCVGIGGHLVTITGSAEDAAVLAAQNPAENPWIGATDDANDTDSIFDWVTDEAFGYTHYAAGQPDDDIGLGGNGECLHIVNGLGEWNDTNCNFVGFVVGRICEVEKFPCGDGVVEGSETCDDGGNAASDGCSATCTIELGWTCSGNPSLCSPNGLWFNEYIEGSANNKAVEVLNATGTATNLTGCSVRIYSNGSATVSGTVPLTGTVAAGDVYTVCNNSASFAASCDQVSGTINYNGNDAVELFCAGTRLDVIGQIGFNPITEWGTGLASTADNTLRRKCSVTIGDSNGSDVFDPSIQWVGFATDDFTGIGSPACSP